MYNIPTLHFVLFSKFVIKRLHKCLFEIDTYEKRVIFNGSRFDYGRFGKRMELCVVKDCEIHAMRSKIFVDVFIWG